MNSKDTQRLLKEHQIPSLDVDWLIRSTTKKNSNDITKESPRTEAITKEKVVAPKQGTTNERDPDRFKKRNSIATATVLPDPNTAGTEHHHHHHHHHEEETAQVSPSSSLPSADNLPLRRSKSISVGDSASHRRRGSLASSDESSLNKGEKKKLGFFRS